MRTVRAAGWVTLVGVVFVVACGKGGGGPGDPRDVRGNYALTYDNKLKLTLNVGGAVREVTQNGYGGIIDFGVVNGQPTTLDLTSFCSQSVVTCPSESFWAKVAIDQPDLSKNGLDLQQLQVIDDTVHTPPAGQKAAAAAGLVDHAYEDRFLLGLGINGGASGVCAALGLSFAQGRFSHVGERFEPVTVYRTPSGAACTPADGGTDAGQSDGGTDGGADAGAPPPCNPVQIQKLVVPPDAGVNGIAEGKVVLAWAGGCAFGPILAGATLVAETGYTATRTGNFDPPPFTPAPVVLPDGGLPDGGASDGGSDGGSSDGGSDGGDGG